MTIKSKMLIKAYCKKCKKPVFIEECNIKIDEKNKIYKIVDGSIEKPILCPECRNPLYSNDSK